MFILGGVASLTKEPATAKSEFLMAAAGPFTSLVIAGVAFVVTQVLLGSINEQRALAWTLFQRGVVQTDYGLASAMSVVLLVIAVVVSYFSLRYSRGALVD